MGFFSRLLGRSSTPPADPNSWSYAEGRLEIDLGKASELSEKGGAIRLAGDGLPRKGILILHGDDDAFHAFINKCTHGGRKLDPLPGTSTVECCSIGKSIFDYDGKRLSGSAKKPIAPLTVNQEGEKLVVEV